MYDNLSSRLRGEAEVSEASPYIKDLMKQAADALDHFENLARTLQSLSNAPTIIPASFENLPKNARYSQDNPAEEGE